MGHYFDRETATPEKPGQSYKTFRGRAAADKTVYLPAEQGKQVFALKQLEPVLKTMKEAVEYAYGPTGPLKDYSRTSATEIPAAMWHQALQTDPKLQGYRRTLESQVQSIVRAFGGRGDFNAQEMEAALGMLPRLGATIGLGLSLGPQYGRGGLGMGVGIRPDIALPDTAGTAQETANQLLGQHRERVQSLMQNPGYKGVPDVQIGAQGPGTPAPATAPPRPTPAPTLTLPPSSPVPGLMPTPAPAPQPVPGRSSALPPDPQTSAAVQPQTMPPTPGLTPGPGGESHRWRWADARPHHGHGSAPSRTGSRATAGTSPRA
jgi:hypothetical protein